MAVVIQFPDGKYLHREKRGKGRSLVDEIDHATTVPDRKAAEAELKYCLQYTRIQLPEGESVRLVPVNIIPVDWRVTRETDQLYNPRSDTKKKKG